MSRVRTLPKMGLLISMGIIVSCADELPSSAELAREFPARHAALDTLRQMSNQDARVVRIAPDFTLLDGSFAWPRPDSLLGISHARWDEYRRLFKRVGSENGLGRGPDGRLEIVIKAIGIVNRGASRGYMFSPTLPAPVATSLELLPRRNKVRYQPLSGGWYIFDSHD